MEAAAISRRAFIKCGAVVLSSTALGFQGISLFGCASPASYASATTLVVEGSQFTIKPAMYKREFSGAKLSVVSDLGEQKIKVAYLDPSGLEVMEDLASLGDEVAIDFGDELMYGPVLDLRFDDSIAEDGADQVAPVDGDRAEYYRITRAPGLWPDSVEPDYYLGLGCCSFYKDDDKPVPNTFVCYDQTAYTFFTAKDPLL